MVVSLAERVRRLSRSRVAPLDTLYIASLAFNRSQPLRTCTSRLRRFRRTSSSPYCSSTRFLECLCLFHSNLRRPPALSLSPPSPPFDVSSQQARFNDERSSALSHSVPDREMASPTAAEPAAKRQKVAEQPLPFHSTLLARDNVDRLRTAHAASAPYKHAVVDQLFDEGFLKRARKEITEQLSFRLKETDICAFSPPLER